MMEYDNYARMQQAAERAARVADDYARANARSYGRRARSQPAPAMGAGRPARTGRSAARPQMEA
jgi:hypothetical protein